MNETGDADRPPRVRVTSPRTRAARPVARRTGVSEIDAETRLGDIYMRSLLRTQLRLAVAVVSVVAALAGGVPLVLRAIPSLAERMVLGMPLPWVVLGAAPYPVLLLIGVLYVRAAERNEADFRGMVEDPGDDPGERRAQ